MKSGVSGGTRLQSPRFLPSCPFRSQDARRVHFVCRETASWGAVRRPTLTGQETSDGQSEGVVGAEAVGARFVVFALLLGVSSGRGVAQGLQSHGTPA